MLCWYGILYFYPLTELFDDDMWSCDKAPRHIHLSSSTSVSYLYAALMSGMLVLLTSLPATPSLV